MTPQERLKKTIGAEAKRGSSVFEEIYIHGTNKKARVVFGDFRKADKNEETVDLSDEISFLNVELSTCSRGIDVTYNTIVYRVENFTQVVKGIYNIFAVRVTKTGRFK